MRKEELQSWEYRMSEVEYINLREYGYVIVRKYEYGDGSPTRYDGTIFKAQTGETSITEMHPTIGDVKQEASKRIFK